MPFPVATTPRARARDDSQSEEEEQRHAEQQRRRTSLAAELFGHRFEKRSERVGGAERDAVCGRGTESGDPGSTGVERNRSERHRSTL